MPQNLTGNFPNSEFLKTELEAREKCHQSYQGKSSTTTKYATAAALITGDGKTNCTFCRGKHSTSYCHVITDINERKRILRKQEDVSCVFVKQVILQGIVIHR